MTEPSLAAVAKQVTAGAAAQALRPQRGTP